LIAFFDSAFAFATPHRAVIANRPLGLVRGIRFEGPVFDSDGPVDRSGRDGRMDLVGGLGRAVVVDPNSNGFLDEPGHARQLDFGDVLEGGQILGSQFGRSLHHAPNLPGPASAGMSLRVHAT